MEFHISRAIREKLELDEVLFSYTGNVVFANIAASRKLAQALTRVREAAEAGSGKPVEAVNAGALFAMGLIDELSHALIARYRKEVDPAVFSDALRWLEASVGRVEVERLLLTFTEHFPGAAVYRGETTGREWLAGSQDGVPNREAALEELLLLWLANGNSGFAPFHDLFEDKALEQQTIYKGATASLPEYFMTRPPVSPAFATLLEALRAPMLAAPGSLTGQLDFIREHWIEYLAGNLAEELRRTLREVLLAIDTLREEELAIWMRFHPPGPDRFGHGEPGRHTQGFLGDEYIGFDEDFVVGPDGIRRAKRYASDHQAPLHEYEAFSQDQAWMPNVVLMAKSTYVWLEQLSKKYGRHIHRLDQVPEEELKLLADRGMTALWLIGLWERSTASRTIKHMRGHSDAVASAYSLKEYCIAEDLGGKGAYEALRDRAARFGLRLASDMVPNHMGIDSTWVVDHPDWFISRAESPFPAYRFEGPDLSTDSRVEIKIEDHYFDQTDAAVVFRLRHHRDGETRFVYHGNDGTTFAWNDTAQLDYSKAHVCEEVIQAILQVARLFPIIRFDAAMTLAKRHVQRLWFPLPGVGGSIPSRAESAMSQDEFDALMPNEFWREVVDRVAVEVPGTLLLAEAFWMLEGYFVRTLGMHRVYNSAFMNMLRDEENAKYRSYLKKTIEFDPDILKRYVNFMSNPDERTAIDQFGDGDKFFGTCTLMATLPGLPMFGHGQVEGFTERYGMEFKQAKMDESPNEGLVGRHQREIAPLLKNRWLFAESTDFVLYDFWSEHGGVDENVFAYSNRAHGHRALVLYNNVYQSTRGTVHVSAASMDKGSGQLRQRTLSEGLDLSADHSLVVAYRDPVRQLEYLRRASDLANHGLTISLDGYGHMVLQNWQQLHSTTEKPWDRLCDSLNGGGVPSLEEAISKLRLGPLHEALREALSVENVRAFAAVAAEVAAEVVGRKAGPAAGAEETGERAKLALDAVPEGETIEAEAVSAPSDATVAGKPAAGKNALGGPLDPRLHPFFEKRAFFLQQASEVCGRDVAAGPAERFAQALRLPALELQALQQEDAGALAAGAPGRLALEAGASARGGRQWAPVLAFLLLGDLAPMEPSSADLSPAKHSPANLGPAELSSANLFSAEEKASLFDSLHLRVALAEAFQNVGIEGEDAWRAAARVRLLLTVPASASPNLLHADGLWKDPDVRWLAGVSQAHGTTYLNKEGFEGLLSWMQLPALLACAEEDRLEVLQGIEAEFLRACDTAQLAGYKLAEYLRRMQPAGAAAELLPLEQAGQGEEAEDLAEERVPVPTAGGGE